MKTARKALMLILCAALLVSATVMGTLAYLTSNDSVTNTFSVGQVKITLTEAPVDAEGQATDGDRVKANAYKLYPGKEYDKDPTVFVDANSEDCWLFVKVENGIAQIEANGEGNDTIAEQIAANGWTLVSGETNVYARATTNVARDSVKVFESFAIAESVTNDTLANYGTAMVNVTAYAVQADGFDTAADAWAAAKTELSA